MSLSQQEIPWDSDPVITVGNACIMWGDLCWEQLLVMEGAQFNLINGGWTSDASIAFGDGFATVQQDGQAVAEYCWRMGETINYYAILRTQQEKTEAKQELAQMLLSIFTDLLGFIPFDTGGLLGAFAKFVADIVPVTEAVASGIAKMAEFIGQAETFVLDGTASGLEKIGMSPGWAKLMAGITAGTAMDFTKFAARYSAVNAVGSAVAYGAAGLPVGAHQLSPVPTDGAGAGELATLFFLQGLGKGLTFGGKGGKGGNLESPRNGPLSDHCAQRRKPAAGLCSGNRPQSCCLAQGVHAKPRLACRLRKLRKFPARPFGKPTALCVSLAGCTPGFAGCASAAIWRRGARK